MLKFIHFITSLLLLLFAFIASAQTAKHTLSGRFEPPAQPSVSEIVYLFTPESKLVKSEIPDAAGAFVFSDIEAGTYKLVLSRDGVTVYENTSVQIQANRELGTLAVSAQQLAEVTVTTAKPYLQRQEGKTVLNVENSIAATGSSAFEVLERAPGVRIDANDNISLRGKGGLLIQIDGKPTPMTGSSLGNYLRGLPSGMVDKIEFITNPSAKYDAAGSSIINIKLKKDKRKGSNGSVATSIGKGQYWKNNNTLSLNQRNQTVNLFGSYSFAYREGFNDLLLQRRFYENGQFDGAFNQDNYLRLNFRNHIARLGADWTPNDKHSFGITLGGLSNRFNPSGNNASNVYDANGNFASWFGTESRSRDKWHNYSANINYKFTIDTTGTALTTDLDFAQYGNSSVQHFDTRYLFLDPAIPANLYKLYGDIAGDLRLYSGKADFVKAWGKTKMETGVKSSYVKADNDVAFYDRTSGTDVFDSGKSNHFIYTENINAAYVNGSRALGKWNFQLGLRVENTHITGEQVVNNTRFEDDYTQFFPTALASYTFNDTHGLEMNYSRRIQRPSYDQLNPFKFYLDPTTYKAGNPYLKPQTTQSIELTHTFKQKVFTTLSFARTFNNITETVSPSITEDKVTVQSLQNLQYVDIYGLFIIWPVNPAPWWEITNNINAYWGSYNGTVAATTLSSAGNFTWNVNSNHTFKLGHGFVAEFSGEFRAREQYAFDRIEPIWFVNSGLQKKFEKYGTLKLAMTDMLRTNRIKATMNYTNYRESFNVGRDSQVVTLSYTYNFGQGGPAKRRSGGAEDLKRRVGNGAG